MIFQSLRVLILLPIVLGLIFYANRRESNYGIKFSSSAFLKGFRGTFKTRLSKNIIFLRVLAIIFIFLALARPQAKIGDYKIEAEGIDIVLAIDVSGSMRAQDFRLGAKRADRLEVIKDVVKDFINGRSSDRIGIVIFAASPFTVSPLTLDYDWLLKNLERVEIGMAGDGTAIGSGLSSALNRLKDTGAKGKVVILLTDGVNNAGKISPLTAAEAAQALDIKVYTIGAGTKGLSPYPVKDFFGNTVYKQVKVEIDEDTLKKIASKTNAEYFRATDTKSLQKIYQAIDKLETVPIQEQGYVEYNELFAHFLIPGLILLLLEIILGNTILRRIP